MGENKLDKAAELHVKTTATPYTVDAAGTVTLKQENGEGTEAAGKDIVIEGIASTAKLEEVKDQLKGEIKTNSDKLGELDTKVNTKFKEVKDLSDANKEKVDSLKQSFDARVTSVDNTLADHNARLEDTKDKIDGIKQKIDNELATNTSVTDKINTLKTELGSETNLYFAGDKTIDEHSTPDDPADDDNTASKLSLNLKEKTLKVKGTANEIETTAKGDTITLALSKAVKDDLAKVAQLGDTSADGRDGANGTAKDTGLTAKDGLNGKTLTEKVNAIRNGEAGSVVYTDDQGNRLTKANDGKYYLADDVGEDGNKKGSAQPVETDKLQVNAVNPLDPTKGVKMSNLVDGKIAANSKDAVTGNQVYNTTNSIATALGGGASVNTDGILSEPTYNLKDKNGNAVTKHNVGDALATINDRFDSISSATNVEVDKLKDMENLTDTGKKNIKRLVGEGINIKGDGKIIATAHTDESGNKTFSLQLSRDMATADQVNEVRQKAEQNSKRISEVGAHSAALAALNPLSYDPMRKSQIMAGVGTYAGNQALALGLAHYANENFMVTAGLTMGAGKSMANLGATYRFGTGEDDAIPERYKGGPISSVYVMQDEITALKAENARKDAENAEMKAQIKMLMERMGLA